VRGSTPAPSPPTATEPPGTEAKQVAAVRLFVLTTRKKTDSVGSDLRFGTDRGSETAAAATVTIPRDHRLGSLESPSIWRLDFREDPAKHVTVRDLATIPRERLIGVGDVADRQGQGALIYVPGWNVDLDQALRRAATLSYDLGFPGRTIVYSWPSADRVASYAADQLNAEWSTPTLTGLLSDIGASPASVNIVALNLGGRIAINAVRALPFAEGSPPVANLVLVNPDIDLQLFRSLVSELTPRVRRITVYISKDDTASRAAKLYGGYPRLGDAGSMPMFSNSNIDIIDVATEGDQLGYASENTAVLADIFGVLRGRSPGDRPGLQRVNSWWRLGR